MNLATARRIAREISLVLAPACARLEIAGSLRRAQPEVGDIELVSIPRPARPVFGQMSTNALALLTLDLRSRERLLPRLDRNGREAWGRKYLRGLWQADDGGRYPLDLFITTPDRWGVIFALRTGSAEFSHRLVTPQEYGGAMPTCMSCRDGRLWTVPHAEAQKDEETALDTPEELDVFAALNLPWIEPCHRSGDHLRHVLQTARMSTDI